MRGLPTGFVTFMFTDVVGSTRIHQNLGPQFVELIDEHDRLLRDVAERHGGQVVKGLGDGLLVVFTSGSAALAAAQDAQACVTAHRWPGEARVTIRVGLHAGEGLPRENDYVSLAVHQAARVVAAAEGGQVLLTEAVAAQVDRDALHYLGRFRLRDFDEPQRLYQPAADELVHQPHAVPADAWVARPRTSFVGRSKELAFVRKCLFEDRLVTLVAPGGAGKTRLAVQVATELTGEDGYEVWLADLAALRAGSSVGSAVATAVGAGDDVSVEPLAAAAAALATSRGLLVLDNCEHLIDQAAHAADALLAGAGDVAILATSRAPLRVPGERVVHVDPLDVPAPEVTDPETLMHLDAVVLFADRAAAAGLDVDLRADAALIAGIARKLDGLPLALELAAARAPSFGLEELNRALDEPLQVLGTAARGGADRHQTLERLIRWSYDLLDDDERAVLRRVSVFGGGFTLDAAAEVCSFGGIDARTSRAAVVSLAEKSLLRAVTGEAGTRYRCLVSIGLFARDRAREAGEYDECIERHLHWITELAQTAQLAIRGRGQLDWLRTMRDEAANVQTAGERALRRNPHAALALAAAAAEPLRWTRQTRDLVEASLAAAPDAPADLRARARFLLMMDDWTTAGDTPDAIPELRELIAAMAAGHDDRNVAAARILLASFLHRLGQREEAHEELERARLLAGELDDRYLLATEVWERGWQFLSRGDYPSAETLLEDAAARFDDIGNRLHAARVNLGLGFAKGAQGDWEAQAELARTALATFDAFGAERPRFLSHIRLLSAERELGRLDAAAYHGRIAWQALNRLGRAERYLLSDVARETALLLAVAGEPEAAAVVFGWQRALIETTGVIEDESEEEMATRTRALVRGALAPERADVAIERGATGDDESVAQIARAALMRLERG